jgi:hypothetical protein
LPDDAAVGGTHGNGGLAESVERAARLLHLPRVLHVGCNARQYLGRTDGLGDIVGAARCKGCDDVFGLGQPGHEQDGNVLG